MTSNVREQIETLQAMTITELRQRYAEVFGEETRSSHKRFLRIRKNYDRTVNISRDKQQRQN